VFRAFSVSRVNWPSNPEAIRPGREFSCGDILVTPGLPCSDRSETGRPTGRPQQSRAAGGRGLEFQADDPLPGPHLGVRLGQLRAAMLSGSLENG